VPRSSIAFLVASTLLSLCNSASAQPIGDPVTHSIIVNVRDSHGNVLRDLTKDNFRVRIAGEPAKVLDASYGVAPRRIVVLLDMSGSMAGFPEKNKKWKITRQVVEDLLDEAPPNVQIALLTFSDKTLEVFDFSQGRAILREWLTRGPSQHPIARGQTALLDSILAAIKLLRPHHLGDAIYAITDGFDNVSHSSARIVEEVLSASGIRLFALLLSDYVLEEMVTLGRLDFIEIARDSGGFVFGLSSRGEAPENKFSPLKRFDYEFNEQMRDTIKDLTRLLCVQINGFYSLLIVEPNLQKTGTLRLEVRDKSGKVAKGITFTCPSMIVPKLDSNRAQMITRADTF